MKAISKITKPDILVFCRNFFLLASVFFLLSVWFPALLGNSQPYPAASLGAVALCLFGALFAERKKRLNY